MLKQMTYIPTFEDSYYKQAHELNQLDNNETNNNSLSPQMKNSSKKQVNEPKFIKQLRSKDIKLSHKKINAFSNKASPNPKLASSFQIQQQPLSHSKSPQVQSHESQQVKKSSKNKKQQNPQKLKQKQKSIQVGTTFNPESIMYSKESLNINRQKYTKKLRASELNHLQQRVRQSRSQNKRQKVNTNTNNNAHKNNTKNSHENQSNIFQSIDLFTKQNSYHSLDKNSQVNYANDKMMPNFSLKIEEKLHLPSLVSNSGLKNVKSKMQQSINLIHEHHDTEIQRSNFYQDETSKTQKSTPFIQKFVKIPIDRLKPLKPEEIKLKYEQKVKQEQKNRAKQRAIDIFQKDEEQASKRKKVQANPNFQPQSDENSELYEEEIRRIQSKEVDQLKNKKSVPKQEKFASSRGQNIFKKKLIAYNGH